MLCRVVQHPMLAVSSLSLLVLRCAAWCQLLVTAKTRPSVTSCPNPHSDTLTCMASSACVPAGVCISRSSGMLFQANRLVLWIMPMLQCLLLVFFGLDAIWHVWWNWGLLSLCFVAGLLGGAVYVNSFTLMTHEVDPALREFSLSAACVADSIGIAAADLTAILIQGCLFKLQGLTGAAFSCGATKV